MSAKTIQQTLGVSYVTTWTMLQCFRVAMVNTEREKLSGKVEVDETQVGGVDVGGKRGRCSKKSLVVIAIEIHEPKGFGRVRMRYMLDASSSSLTGFINDVVCSGSTICTDGWSGYNELESLGYNHEVTVMSHSDDQAHVSMPGVHRIAALLKRWILGTHQGSFSQEHLQSYLEEYTFRFNRRLSKNRGLVFRRLLEQAIITSPVTRKDVTYGYRFPIHFTIVAEQFETDMKTLYAFLNNVEKDEKQEKILEEVKDKLRLEIVNNLIENKISKRELSAKYPIGIVKKLFLW